LLCTLADAYDKIDVTHGNYLWPLHSIRIILFLVIYTCRVSLLCCPFSGSYTTSYLWKTCSSSLA
jgi:hypothetical protein